MIFRTRIVNTAGQLDSGKVKSRTLLMTRNEYQRPSLPHRLIPKASARPDTSFSAELPQQAAAFDLSASLPPGSRPPLFGQFGADTTVTFSVPELDVPPVNEEPIAKPKPGPFRKRIITFDTPDTDLPPPAPPRPRAKSHEETDLAADQPIRASGVYNLGEDIEFDEAPVPAVKKRPPPLRTHSKPIPRAKPKPTVAVALPRLPKVSLPQILEKLKSSEWTDQNQAIAELASNLDKLPVQSELRGVMTSLLDCAASIRSALAKAALTCVLQLLNSGLDFDQNASLCAGSLLGLVISHKDKHFIAELAEQCFSQLIESVPPLTALDVLVGEHRRKHDDARVQVTAAMIKLVPRLVDCSRLLRPLVTLLKDRNPNVRRLARSAVSALRGRAGNFHEMIRAFESEEDRRALLEAA
jgi:hypothetical protein